MNFQMPAESRMRGQRSATGDYQKVLRLYNNAMDSLGVMHDRISAVEARVKEIEAKTCKRGPGRPKKVDSE